MDSLWKDIRYAFRTLIKRPGFTIITVLTLGLGIGASTSIFSVVDAVLLRPLPYPNPQQIVRVWEQAADGHHMNLAEPNFRDLREQNDTFASLAAYEEGLSSISGGSEPTRVNIASVSKDFFAALGVQPFLGRGFAPDEQRAHGALAIIVSYGYWQRYLGSETDLSKFHLSLEGGVYPVVGVMPRGFDFPEHEAAWISGEVYGPANARTAHNWRGVGRIRDGVSLAQARANLSAIAHRIKDQYGKEVDLADAAVVPLAAALVGQVRTSLLNLLGAVGLLLLIACANVAGLLVARTSARRKELAVRAALGAGRRRLVQQLLAESLALALAGGALGVLIALWTTSLLPAILPASLPRQQGIAINGSVLSFTIAATLIVAVGLGLFAAWRAGGVDLNDALSAGSRGYSAGSQRTRSVLVIGEIAATLVMLVGAGLLGRSFLRLISVSPGFSGENLLVLKFSLPQPQDELTPQQKQAEIARQTQFLDNALQRVQAIPGVESAGVTGALPIADPEGFNDGLFLLLNGHSAPTNFDEWGRMAQNTKETGQADRTVASAGFFRATGIPLLR